MDNQVVQKVTQGNLLKLILEMAIPSALSMLIVIVYGLTDTYFVSKIDVNAIAAVGISLSFMNVIQAFGLLFGHGSGNYISHMKGKNLQLESEKMAVTGFGIAFMVGLLIFIFCVANMDWLVVFLGAKNELISIAKEYLLILFIATPFAISSLTLNNQLRLQGKPKIGAVALMIGAILNCVLDPIFIFVFQLGVKGAAYATLCGQVVSFVLLLYYMQFKNDIKMKYQNISVNKEILSELFMGGLPNFSREIFIAISFVISNNILAFYGNTYVAAFALVAKLIQAGTYIMVGIGHGFQPICGMNYGAGLYQRVAKAFHITLWVSITFVCILGIFFIYKGQFAIKLFSDDIDVIDIATTALKIQAFTLPAIAYITIAGMFLQNTHQFKMATIITISRQGLIYIPCIYVLNFIWGIDGVYFSQVVADAITLFISVYFVRKNVKALTAFG